MKRNSIHLWHLAFAAVMAGFVAMLCSAQEITEAEYFLNQDPGVGSGTAISIPAGAGIGSFTISVSQAQIDALPTGLHSLSVRVRQDDDEWSPAITRTFHKNEIGGDEPSSSVISAEYFLNDDPGPGNGIALADLNSGLVIQSLQQIAPSELAALPDGLNWLGVRALDGNGHWSPAVARPFIMNEIGGDPGTFVTRIEYRWYQNGTAISPIYQIPVTSHVGQAQIGQTAILAGLIEGQSYHLVVRAFDDSGLPSPATTVDVMIGVGGFPLWDTLAELPGNRRGPFDTNSPLDLPNLLVYAMGLNPLNATAADLPQVGAHDAQADTVTFRYRRATDTPGTTLKPVVSTDLADWQDADTTNLVVIDTHDDWKLVELTLPAPPSGRLFLRLEAQLNP